MGLWRRGGQRTRGEHDEVVILGREVIACAYPSELVAFDDVACDLRRGRVPSVRRTRPPAEPDALADSISPALIGVLQALAAAVGSTLPTLPGPLTEPGRRRIATLLNRHPGAAALDPAEEDSVHRTLVEAAMTRHALSRDNAEQLGTAVIGALRLRADGRL
ncbi:hypothetical protein J2S43_002138 [Catenuloplanes nepalensis]|uniref:Uncharacterized protein n=1 Tax=Catenuloplanes nepalensis TaxID=587533 RepID=A0ABT9MRH5_9ACTN|nr:hypothetical protein [Catenuloplanes nepalensis]MDP9793626.1 hypothetical protein [Catenuloplanes nepalensis]